MNRTKIFFIVLIVFLLVCVAFGQNKKPVLLSEKVGFVIDKTKRTQYQMFPKIKGFIEARFYLDSNGRYFSNILFENDDNIKKDTIKYYSKEEIIRFAEQIQFFDEFQKGKHTLGNVKDSIATKDDVVYIVLKDITKPVYYYEFQKLKQITENNYPDFGIGFSMVHSNIDFSPVTNIIDLAENYLITQGFNIYKQNLTLNTTPVSIFNAYVNLYKGIGLSAEIGLRKIGDSSDFHYASLMLQYHFGIKNLEWLKPHIAIGITNYEYKVLYHYLAYNQEMTQYVESISSEGGASGFIVKYGADIQIIKFSKKSSLVFDIFGKYELLNEQESIDYGYKTTVKLSNFSVGGGFKIYF